MGRAVIYVAIAALAAFLLLFFGIFQRGGGSSEAFMRISVHDLSVAPEAHAGEHVVTIGILRRVLEPEEHFLVTEGGLGIIIRGYDFLALRPLDGRPVTVTGRFGFDGLEGTYIEAESVDRR